MYTDFYHLKKQPFSNTPDPEFLYLSPSHEEALSSIVYGVEQKKGLMIIIGEVGVGKTTILHAYLKQAERKPLKCIPVFTSDLTFEELLDTIYDKLELPVEPDSVFKKTEYLREELIKINEQGTGVVLIIDEAEKMPAETLDKLCSLSNLETDTQKLIQIVMAARPEFDDILDRHGLRQIKQRIAIRTTIVPLTARESLEYINHRLSRSVTNSNDPPIFKKGALKTIIATAQGFPRLINIICDNALAAGFGYNRNPVDRKVLKEVIADFEETTKPLSPRWKSVAQYAALALVTFIAIFILIDFSVKQLNQRTGQPANRATIGGQANRGTNHPAGRPATTDGVLIQNEDKAGPVIKERGHNPEQDNVPGNMILMARPGSPDNSTAEVIVARPVSPHKVPPATADTRGLPDSNSAIAGVITSEATYEKSSTEDTDPTRPAEKDVTVPRDGQQKRTMENPIITEKRAWDLPAEKFPATRTVKQGDNLYRLTLNVYGFANDKLIVWVMKHNPHLTDTTMIKVGDEIIFPPPEKIRDIH